MSEPINSRDRSHTGARAVGVRDLGVDRSSYEPAYMQIVRILSEQIASGHYRAGDQLPSEAQLCAQFAVSPMTVRRSVNILVDRGLVSATQGKGTFVRALDMREAVFHLREITDQWGSGAQIDVRLLEASIVPATERVAAALGCALGDRTVYLRRLLLREGSPVAYHREHLLYDPHRPLVEAQLRITSLEGLLQGAGTEGLRRGDLSIQAVNLAEEAAGLLGLSVGSAAFCLEHIFFDLTDTPVSWGWFLCRADQFSLTSSIGADAVMRGGN